MHIRRPGTQLRAIALATLVLAAPAVARAETPTWDPGTRATDRLPGEVVPEDGPRFDGVYDRFAGDVTVTIGLGAELGSGTRGALMGRALYYHTAGLVLGYSDALWMDSALERVLFVGGEVRPLFLPRWSLDMQIGVPILDLMLDSLSFGAGAYFSAYRGSDFGDHSGFEASIGFGVPLFQSARGPWLEARGTFRSGLPEEDLGLVLLFSLYEAWISPVIE